MDNLAFEFGGRNVGGEGNYVILEAEGAGHYVGCNLNFHNLRTDPELAWPEEKNWPVTQAESKESTPEERMEFFKSFNWYGEGDDMIFIDGEEWPPSLHGTGTEDYFNTAYCPAVKYDSPYHGLTLPGGPNWSGKSSYYRFHIEDPIHFRAASKSPSSTATTTTAPTTSPALPTGTSWSRTSRFRSCRLWMSDCLVPI